VKFQNVFGVIPIYKALQLYAVLKFKDINQMEQLIEKNGIKKADRGESL